MQLAGASMGETRTCVLTVTLLIATIAQIHWANAQEACSTIQVSQNSAVITGVAPPDSNTYRCLIETNKILGEHGP